MSDKSAQKVTVFATHGPEDPERATLPFLMANAALVEGCESVVILQGPGVLLAKQGIVEHVFGATLPALSEQLASFLGGGGRLLACTPCLRERKIEPEMLIEGVELTNAAHVIKEVTESSATLNY